MSKLSKLGAQSGVALKQNAEVLPNVHYRRREHARLLLSELLLRKLIVLVALVLISRSATWASAPVTLTSLHALHSLDNAEASRAIPAAFQATVVYSRGYESLLFVQDADDALFVSPPTTAALHPGDR